MVTRINWFKFWGLKILEVLGAGIYFYFVTLIAFYVDKNSNPQSTISFFASWLMAFLLSILCLMIIVIIGIGIKYGITLWINKNLEWSTEIVEEKPKRK